MTILHNKLTTPLGVMHILAREKGVCLVEFEDRKILKKEFSDLERLLKSTISKGENDHIQSAKQQLTAYFMGELTSFSVALEIVGTAFQQKVWQSLQSIPYGQTVSYAEQARRLNKPTAYRAVAGANGQNRISIILPCHRVIGKNGTLTGYGGGLERKKWLLEHERKTLHL